MERYLRVNLLGPGHRLMKKIIYRAAVSQRLRNTGLKELPYKAQYLNKVESVIKKECFLKTETSPSFHSRSQTPSAQGTLPKNCQDVYQS